MPGQHVYIYFQVLSPLTGEAAHVYRTHRLVPLAAPGLPAPGPCGPRVPLRASPARRPLGGFLLGPWRPLPGPFGVRPDSARELIVLL